MDVTRSGPLSRGAAVAASALLLASGFAGLVYEVVWMRELGLVLGNTARAAAATLAAFFLAFGAGSQVLGRRAVGWRRPLRAYGLLELATAAAAAVFLLSRGAVGAVDAAVFRTFGPAHPLGEVARLLAGSVPILPAAFCMGGTLPAIAGAFARDARALGRSGPILYLVNTVGAVLGALAAGFALPSRIGYAATYGVALAISAAAGGAACLLDAVRPAAVPAAAVPPAPDPGPGRALLALAFLSGALTLALEVLATRAFAQVLQNSAHTYAVVLAAFLASLAAGAGLAALLARSGRAPRAVLAAVLTTSGIAAAACPFVFHWRTGGLAGLGGDLDWTGYLLAVAGSACLVVFPAGVLGGSVLPYLFRLSAGAPPESVGRLGAANSAGAIAGSVAGGFFLLDAAGLWASFRWVATIYLLAGALVAFRAGGRRGALAALVPVALAAILSTWFDPGRLPVVHLEPDEELLWVHESGAGVVALVRDGENVRVKLDGRYTLGDLASRPHEEREANLPLLLHPRPRRVIFLGLGTGITPAAALSHPVERVVVCELVPDVIEASRRGFAPWIRGLHEDRRATILAEDARRYLAATGEAFDVVIGDLFVPWGAGTGSLYSVEHFRLVRERLATGGLFFQWLPLYQMSREEFEAIARAFLEAFGQVELWRGDFLGQYPILALAGHRGPGPLDSGSVARRLDEARAAGMRHAPLGDAGAGSAIDPDRAPLLAHYGGNLSASGVLAAEGPVDSDDLPLVEFLAARSHRRWVAGRGDRFVGSELIGFYGELLDRVPPERDPYLASVAESDRRWVRIGLEFHRSRARAEPRGR